MLTPDASLMADDKIPFEKTYSSKSNLLDDYTQTWEAQVAAKKCFAEDLSKACSLVRTELSNTNSTHATGPSGSLEDRIGRIEVMLMNMQARQMNMQVHA